MPRRRNARIRKRGFSLLEMLMAIVLLAVGLLAVMQAFSGGLFAGVNTENNMTALYLAQEKLEELKGSGFSAVTDETRVSNEVSLGTLGAVFDREVIVTDVAPDLKQVEVFVYWTPRGQEVNLRLITYRVDPS
jgi:type IV pilus assembly protein PilV